MAHNKLRIKIYNYLIMNKLIVENDISSKRRLCILLDNGHGTRKYTKGKCSPDKRIYEGEWNREFVKLLQQELNRYKIDTMVLVPEDEDVSLSERVNRANEYTKQLKADGIDTLLISVHINAAKSDSKYHDARGWTVWLYTSAGVKSRKAGQIFSAAAKKMKLTGNRVLPLLGYYTANFYILKHTVCPAILCENMFMDNKEDEAFLLSEEGKKTLIQLYINSILEYMNAYSYDSYNGN